MHELPREVYPRLLLLLLLLVVVGANTNTARDSPCTIASCIRRSFSLHFHFHFRFRSGAVACTARPFCGYSIRRHQGSIHRGVGLATLVQTRHTLLSVQLSLSLPWNLNLNLNLALPLRFALRVRLLFFLPGRWSAWRRYDIIIGITQHTV